MKTSDFINSNCYITILNKGISFPIKDILECEMISPEEVLEKIESEDGNIGDLILELEDIAYEFLTDNLQIDVEI